MRHSNRIVFASLNMDKFAEFKALLAAYPEIELVPAESILRNPEKLAFVETHMSYLENAAAKARLANVGSHYPSLGDDTGLEVDALGGRPGVRSHRFAQAPNGVSLSQTEQRRANIELLLSELAKKPGEPLTARFITTLVLVIEGISLHATGTLEGEIIDSPRGEFGFGYDAVFIPKDSHRTLAEMTPEEKNAISHRALAIHELMAQVKSRGILFAKP